MDDGSAEDASERTERRDPLIGATLGGYVIKHFLGRGGMGVVYLAEQPDIGKAVAIKVLKAEVSAEPDQLKRLADEARVVSALRHRGIIDIFGFGTTADGRPYIVMEYLDGDPLDAYLARYRKLSAAEAIPILDEVLAAVGVAHKAGVVHRDLKPGNIFLALDSDGTRYIKVLDFGLAKKAQQPYGSASQTAFRPAGTPEYMAPEQAKGDRVGPRSDLYSMGVVAYELLTGDLPFNSSSYVEILLKHVSEPPPSVSATEPSVPPELDSLILELLQKKPEMRPQSAEAVRKRLKQIARALTEAGTQVRGPRPSPPVAVSPPREAEPTPTNLGPAPVSPTEIRPATRVQPPGAAEPTRISEPARIAEPPRAAEAAPARVPRTQPSEPSAHEPTVLSAPPSGATRVAPTDRDLRASKSKKNPSLVRVGVALLVAAVVGGALALWRSESAPKEPVGLAVLAPSPQPPIPRADPIVLKEVPASSHPAVSELPPPALTPGRPSRPKTLATALKPSKPQPVIADTGPTNAELSRRVQQLQSHYEAAKVRGKPVDPTWPRLMEKMLQKLAGTEWPEDKRRAFAKQLVDDFEARIPP